MIHRATIKIPRSEERIFQAAMNDNKMLEDYGRDQIIKTYTAKFEGGIEADIKVCNSEDGVWIDPVLFHNGSEVALIEPQYTLLGGYPFKCDGDTYIVTVIPDMDA